MMPALPRARRHQRGIAALELALLLPLLLVLLSFPLYFGRVLWHYTVMQRAAQDAARYLSTIPLSEMKNPGRASAVTAVAAAIVNAEIAELRPGRYPPQLTVLCDGAICSGFNPPATVTVNISLLMDDSLFPDSTGLYLPLTADVSFPYVGM